MPATLMDRVWEAYWQPEPHGTQAALERVVALVLNEAAGVANDAAHDFEMRLKGKYGRPLSETDEGLFESAQSAAVDIAKGIRALSRHSPHDAGQVETSKHEMVPPAGERIRSTQDGSMEAGPVTGQSPVGSASHPTTPEAQAIADLERRLSLRDTFISEKGLWSEFADTVLRANQTTATEESR